MVLCFYRYTISFEELDGVLGEVFIKHGEDLRGYVVYRYFDMGDEIWVESFQVFMTEVKEFSSKLYTGCYEWSESLLHRRISDLRPPPTIAKFKSWSRNLSDVVGHAAVSKPKVISKVLQKTHYSTYILRFAFGS